MIYIYNMARNQPRYSGGRSAIARRAMMSGTGVGNGFMPQGPLKTWQGQVIGPKRYFGGPKKGGAPPSATGFMISSGRRSRMASSAHRPNYLFQFKTGAGPSPWSYGPHA